MGTSLRLTKCTGGSYDTVCYIFYDTNILDGDVIGFMRLKFLPRSWFHENVDKHQILISNKVVDIENLCFQLVIDINIFL